MDIIKIRMRKTVRPDFPLGIIGLLGEKPGTILRVGILIKMVQSPACAKMENV